MALFDISVKRKESQAYFSTKIRRHTLYSPQEPDASSLMCWITYTTTPHRTVFPLTRESFFLKGLPVNTAPTPTTWSFHCNTQAPTDNMQISAQGFVPIQLQTLIQFHRIFMSQNSIHCFLLKHLKMKQLFPAADRTHRTWPTAPRSLTPSKPSPKPQSHYASRRNSLNSLQEKIHLSPSHPTSHSSNVVFTPNSKTSRIYLQIT